MTDEKINQVLDMYEVVLQERHGDVYYVPAVKVLDMIPKLRAFLLEGRRDKAFRWLGFIQGVLWMSGHYSVEELAEHNAPDGAVIDHARS